MILFARSYYSLKFGVLSPEKIISIAQKNTISTVVLTDINNTSGFFELYKIGCEAGIKVIPGCEIRLENVWLYTYVAKNDNGLKQIHDFISYHNLKRLNYPKIPKTLEDCILVFPNKTNYKNDSSSFVALFPKDLRKLIPKEEETKCFYFPLLTFEQEDDFVLHKNLRAIAENTLLSKLDGENLADKLENINSIHNYFLQCDKNRFAIRNNQELETKIAFSIELKQNKNKIIFFGSREEDIEQLKFLCFQGLKKRYKNDDGTATERLNYEIEIIIKLDFVAYFLIAWDIVMFAKSKGFYHVGRGSGANSLAAYCLSITDVDPIELDLYFERFLNPKRTSPPDFDLDFSWKERDEVLEYIFKKHGKKHTALLGTFSTFKDSSIIRELGKIYGLPKAEIDEISLGRKTIKVDNEIIEKIFSIGKKLESFPSHRSIHAGGVLISQQDITNYSALDLPPKGLPTVQWDMYSAEDIGFEKFDILSQRGIGHIKEAAQIIKQNRGLEIDVHKVESFKVDELVKQNLYDGNTIGCFYIESPAMRGLLKKLKCNDYLTLVAASSIIRPGVAKSGMMKQYIKNFHQQEKINYLHPIMEKLLKETFGVMVFQEDVLKVCHHFAGLDLSDADVLRRAMSGKFRSKKEFEKIVEKFFLNCKERGYPDQITNEVWRQVESFAGYSFSKAHSASFAVESFQSLYLKSYFPLEFMVAVINNFGGFYSTWVYVNEAKKQGAKIVLPCINNSNVDTKIVKNEIYLGFAHVATLEKNTIEIILKERAISLFENLNDFFERTNLSKEQLSVLIKVGALRTFGIGKKELLWKIHTSKSSEKKLVNKQLFKLEKNIISLPNLEHTNIEDAYDEMDLIGFFVSLSAFDMLKTKYRGDVMAKDLLNNSKKKVKMLGQLVTIKPVRTVKGDYMNFGTFLDIEGNFFDTVHFAKSLSQNPFTGKGVYLLYGMVVEEFGYPSVEIERMAKLPYHPDPRYS
jgi:DNA-directed DNA polymerase III PolC